MKTIYLIPILMLCLVSCSKGKKENDSSGDSKNDLIEITQQTLPGVVGDYSSIAGKLIIFKSGEFDLETSGEVRFQEGNRSAGKDKDYYADCSFNRKGKLQFFKKKDENFVKLNIESTDVKKASLQRRGDTELAAEDICSKAMEHLNKEHSNRFVLKASFDKGLWIDIQQDLHDYIGSSSDEEYTSADYRPKGQMFGGLFTKTLFNTQEKTVITKQMNKIMTGHYRSSLDPKKVSKYEVDFVNDVMIFINNTCGYKLKLKFEVSATFDTDLVVTPPMDSREILTQNFSNSVTDQFPSEDCRISSTELKAMINDGSFLVSSYQELYYVESTLKIISFTLKNNDIISFYKE